MIKRQLFLIFSLFMFISSLSAQNRGKEIPFRMSIRAMATVPHAISNKAFKRSFIGIYDVALNCNYQVLKGFVAGVQVRNNEWKTADNKIPGINTYAQSFHAGLRVGYDFVRSETSTAYIGVAASQGMVRYFGLSILPGADLSRLQKQFTYHSVDIDGGMFFYTEGSFAIGVNASMVFTNYNFDPYALLLDQHKAYSASDLPGNWAHLDIGFSVIYSFFRTKGAPSN